MRTLNSKVVTRKTQKGRSFGCSIVHNKRINGKPSSEVIVSFGTVREYDSFLAKSKYLTAISDKISSLIRDGSITKEQGMELYSGFIAKLPKSFNHSAQLANPSMWVIIKLKLRLSSIPDIILLWIYHIKTQTELFLAQKQAMAKAYKEDLNARLEEKVKITTEKRAQFRKYSTCKIYFVKDTVTSLTKIGKSVDMQSRMRSLTTGNPQLGEFIVYNGVSTQEKQLHKIFTEQGKHVKGEWFNLTGEDLKFVRNKFFKCPPLGKIKPNPPLTNKDRVKHLTIISRNRPAGKSGFRGVYANGKGWRSSLVYNGVRIHLGTFDTREDAARAYDAKAFELYGCEASLNFPNTI